MSDTVETKGPSKKELAKMKRKEQKASHKTGGASDAAEKAPAEKAVKSINLYYCAESTPEITFAIIGILGVQSSVATHVTKTPSQAFVPYITYDATGGDMSTETLSGDVNISKFLLRNASEFTSPVAYMNLDPFTTSQMDQWCSDLSCIDVNVLNTHLSTRTFLVDDAIGLSLADIAVFTTLRKRLGSAVIEAATFPHVIRWGLLLDALLKPYPSMREVLTATIVKTVKPVVAKKENTKKVESKGKDTEEKDGAICPELEGATEGNVCTRFPPEPSGYLHIGHAKACLLNQYYAQRYKGKLIIRFDDTNPNKEKDEFEQAIIADLERLGVVGDVVTHTSDSFDKIQKLAIQFIKDGHGYMDDTDQEKMQAERLAQVESYRRDTSPEENLKIFEELLAGNPKYTKYCMRAKIDMKSFNGTMRDPVMYRANSTPHHRTGTKYKAYPTYDFACPIVDSIEGVTHALRTTEYDQRDEQYHYLQDVMKLRKVHIMSFGKVNFINTVLSKRKLTWFVDQKLVEGWFDPRFPTVQGCVRRGMNINALKSFILSQGASRKVITMEWDKFWSENKRVLEADSARYMGITKQNIVKFHITNVGEDEHTAVSVPVNPLKPEQGTRVVRRNNVVYVEQEDACTFSEGEEVTFLRWGNFFIDEIRKENGLVIDMKGRFNPDATNFSKTKKATWLAVVPDVVECRLVEFDHIISKSKILDEEDFKDYVNPHTRYETRAICDPYLRTVPSGTVIQLERKGFYRVDTAYDGTNAPVLFCIPDGKKEKSLKEKYNL